MLEGLLVAEADAGYTQRLMAALVVSKRFGDATSQTHPELPQALADGLSSDAQTRYAAMEAALVAMSRDASLQLHSGTSAGVGTRTGGLTLIEHPTTLNGFWWVEEAGGHRMDALDLARSLGDTDAEATLKRNRNLYLGTVGASAAVGYAAFIYAIESDLNPSPEEGLSVQALRLPVSIVAVSALVGGAALVLKRRRKYQFNRHFEPEGLPERIQAHTDVAAP